MIYTAQSISNKAMQIKDIEKLPAQVIAIVLRK